MCNSLWGRFAMRVKRTNHTFANTKEEADKLWYNPTIEIKNDVIMPNSSIWCFVWEPLEESLHSAEYGSLIVGIVTLARARVHLTQLMLEIEGTGPLKRKLPLISYHDTDSLMIKSDTDEEESIVARFIERNSGNNLGDLTNEIEQNYVGVELISPGGKQYLLRVKHEQNGSYKDTVKLRGFTQNWSTKNIFTRENMRQQTCKLQDGKTNEALKCETSRIKKNLGQVSTINLNKNYIARNVKGILKDYVVYPYGYKFNSE